MLFSLLLLMIVLTGCATAIIPAKVKYVTLYELVQPDLPIQAKGAVASVHTDQLALYLPGQVNSGQLAAPRICFTKMPGQNASTNPFLIHWQSHTSCGGGGVVDGPSDRVLALMGGSTEADYMKLLIIFPPNSSTHPFPGGTRIEMTMDIAHTEVTKMYVFLYPRYQATLWDLVAP